MYIFTRISAIKTNKCIQKGVALRLCLICSSDNNYTAKLKEYTKYLVNKEHDIKWVKQCLMVLGKHRERKHGKK